MAKPSSIAFYARALKRDLRARIFDPARTRLAWLPLHLAVVTVAITAIARHWVPWPVVPLLSLVIGGSFAALMFLGHETMHGAVVRAKRPRYLVGFLCFLPFALSPRLWIAWHNRVHHGHANEPGSDPDANPTIAEHRGSRRVRIVTDHFALGRRSSTGFLGLLVGFSVQSAHVLSFARRRGYLIAREHSYALAETAIGVVAWSALAFLIGPVAFLFAFALPVVVANGVVMSFIMTNHGLSPVDYDNDPLFNSLTVTTPRWLTWLTLGFGFHVEHHLFPAMSARNAPEVRALLLKNWPERYQSMSLQGALRALHESARVYKDDLTFYNPRTLEEFPALQPR